MSDAVSGWSHPHLNIKYWNKRLEKGGKKIKQLTSVLIQMLRPFSRAQMCWLIYSWGALSAATVWIDTFMHSVVGVKKSVPVFHCKGLKRGRGALLSPQRGNYCIYDHTKTHALREGDKWVRRTGQGCSALLKGTSAVLWKCPGTSPAIRPLFFSIWSGARDVNLRPPAQWADGASAAPTGQ